MLNIIFCEIKKFKNSKMTWLIFIGAFLPTFLCFWIYKGQADQYPVVKWDLLFRQNETMMNLLMAPALFALVTGFVFTREHQENTINTLFVYPASRLKFLIGKLLVMLPAIALTFALTFTLILLSGCFLKHDVLTSEVILKHLRIYGVMTLMHFALAPAAMAVGIIGKNIVPSMVLGVSAVLCSGIIINSKYNQYFPWCIPTVTAGRMSGMVEMKDSYLLSIAVMVIAFLVFLAVGIFRYCKADVHSGS